MSVRYFSKTRTFRRQRKARSAADMWVQRDQEEATRRICCKFKSWYSSTGRDWSPVSYQLANRAIRDRRIMEKTLWSVSWPKCSIPPCREELLWEPGPSRWRKYFPTNGTWLRCCHASCQICVPWYHTKYAFAGHEYMYPYFDFKRPREVGLRHATSWDTTEALRWVWSVKRVV